MSKLALLIPYRHREEHLSKFVPHIYDYLEGVVDFDLYVIEQPDDGLKFNKGYVLNSGFDYLKDQYEYFCFHDVDMLPERNADYSFVEEPTHISPYCSQHGYELLYDEYLGGAMLIPTQLFIEANGYSTVYWGWGCEDDDLWLRFETIGHPFQRREGYYKGLDHERDGVNSTVTDTPQWYEMRQIYFDMVENPELSMYENGLNTLEYGRISREDDDMYTKLTVEIYPNGKESYI